jgi:hypothetical protein
MQREMNKVTRGSVTSGYACRPQLVPVGTVLPAGLPFSFATEKPPHRQNSPALCLRHQHANGFVAKHHNRQL